MAKRYVSSMQVRLTLLFGLIALAGSCVAGYTLFWALKQEVRHQEIAELTGGTYISTGTIVNYLCFWAGS